MLFLLPISTLLEMLVNYVSYAIGVYSPNLTLKYSSRFYSLALILHFPFAILLYIYNIQDQFTVAEAEKYYEWTDVRL